ncbi:MAG: hypothetical protein J0L92_17220 [Deltaproteobacteria bacterium]|nr:hypothetical protein [Deltaproteobacteria bacterium]
MPTSYLEALVTFALGLGPSGRFALPVLGAAIGLVLFMGAWVLLSQRTAWSARELWRAIRTRMHATEVGERTWIVGRVRAPGRETIASFERSDRRAVVSSLHERVGTSPKCLATRTAPGLTIETRDGLVPLEGLIDVRRTRATRKARNVDDRSRARAISPTALRAADVLEGQWVLAHGTVARIAREGLREQAGVLGLSGGSEVHATESTGAIVLTALRPEVPRGTLAIALLGATSIALLVSPLPWPNGRSLVTITAREPRLAMHGVRLLSPTREMALRELTVSPRSEVEVRWSHLAGLELGDCEPVVLAAYAEHHDEVAIERLQRPGCAIDARTQLILLRDSGHAVSANAFASRAGLSARERSAIASEAGMVIETPPWGDEGRFDPASGEIVCELFCLEAIRGRGEQALDVVEARSAARMQRTFDCTRSETRQLLSELGLRCGEFDAAQGLHAVRHHGRSSTLEPLSHIEARLHVMRVLLENGGDLTGASQLAARQRRILATLSTDGGRSAENQWIGSRLPLGEELEPFRCGNE